MIDHQPKLFVALLTGVAAHPYLIQFCGFSKVNERLHFPAFTKSRNSSTYFSAASLFELMASPCLRTLSIPLWCFNFSNQPPLALKVNQPSPSALVLKVSFRRSAPWICSSFSTSSLSATFACYEQSSLL